MDASHRARAVRVGLLCALLGSASCGPLPLQPAYDTQRDICADPDLFAELIEACRSRWQADGSCGGVIGFTGELQGVPVIVESELLITRFAQVERLEDGAIERGDMSLTARSPYFEYTLSLKDIGGALLGAESGQSLAVGPSASYDDDTVEVALRLATGAESEDIAASSGQLLTEVQGQDEHVASFVLEFDADSAIEGCFHALATETTVGLEELEEQGGEP